MYMQMIIIFKYGAMIGAGLRGVKRIMNMMFIIIYADKKSPAARRQFPRLSAALMVNPHFSPGRWNHDEIRMSSVDCTCMLFYFQGILSLRFALA